MASSAAPEEKAGSDDGGMDFGEAEEITKVLGKVSLGDKDEEDEEEEDDGFSPFDDLARKGT